MKIGFLAMSGIRCQNEKLLSLGLTMPGVLDRGKVIAQLPSLGLLYLAAMTPDGHDLKYYEAANDGDEPDEIYDCDLVAISSFSAQINEAYCVSARLRQRGVKVALGGLHVSVLPDEALQHADYVFIGEGEAFWKQAVAEIEAGTAQRVWNSQDFPAVDVDNLPIPRYDLLANRPYNRFTVQTTRGCPWRCDFCASNVMLRQNYRKRPIADIIRDIK